MAGLKTVLVHIVDGDERVLELGTYLMLVYSVDVIVEIFEFISRLCRLAREEGKHHRQQRSKSKKSFHSHHSINMQLKNNRSRRYKEIAKSTNPKGNIYTLIILFYERIIFCE